MSPDRNISLPRAALSLTPRPCAVRLNIWYIYCNIILLKLIKHIIFCDHGLRVTSPFLSERFLKKCLIHQAPQEGDYHMLRYKVRLFSLWSLLGCLTVMSAGCGFNPLLIMAGSLTTNKSSASTDLATSHLPGDYDVLDTVMKVGLSLGYRLMLKNDDTIGLHYHTSDLIEVATGLTKRADVRITQVEHKLYIQVAVSGDYGTGGQAYADRLMGEFKDGLLEKFAEVAPPPGQRLVQQGAPRL